MSGVYISGISIPKDKEIILRIDKTGEVYLYDAYPTKLYRAISVSNHGRLIDADALEADIFQLDWRTGEEDAVGFSEQAIDEASTIIPADKEDT